MLKPIFTTSQEAGKVSLILALALILSGCWVKKTMCRGLSNMMPGQCKTDDADNAAATENTASIQPAVVSQPAAYPDPIAPTTELKEVVYGSGFALNRITPEQLSRNLIRTTNFGTEYHYDDPNAGQTLDYLQMLFGVPLGGIDFVTAARRDPSTKAQTLLVSRVVAWQFANLAIWKEWETDPSDRVVFTACDMGMDRPFQTTDADYPTATQQTILAGEARWNAQVEELFWRAYARPPTADDKAAIKKAFLAAFNAEGYPQAGWVVTMYAILSSQEFWHI